MEKAKQVPALLTAIEGEAYALLHNNLLDPTKPSEKTFAQLKEAHFDPKPLVIAEQLYFHNITAI